MTAFDPTLPAISAPPAIDGEETFVLNGLVEKNLPLIVEVPQIVLGVGDMIVRHPEDGSEVAWKVTARETDENGRLAVTYRDGDSKGEFTFTDPETWPRVEVGQVLR